MDPPTPAEPREMAAAEGIHPTPDFPAGPAYPMMGLDVPMFTPVSVMSRVTGWMPRIVERRPVPV